MKFGKSISRVVELSDPEWGPYWINYKFLKKKINDIVNAHGGVKISDPTLVSRPSFISKSSCEVDFFKLLKSEMKKVSDFYASTEQLYRIRKTRVWDAFDMLQAEGVIHDKNTWTRLLCACVKFYKDALLLENFAIMNYCGFSKILKKHDKLTGFATREAFMRNVMSQQNFTHYTYVLELIKESEKLYEKIQKMESVMPLQAEERLFLDAIRDLNHQVGKLQEEERDDTKSIISDASSPENFVTMATEITAAPEECVKVVDIVFTKSTTTNVSEGEKVSKVDAGELVNAAAENAMEAAIKLHSSVNSALYPSSTSLHSVVSWANEASSTASAKEAAIIITVEPDETEQDKNIAKTRKRPLSVVE